MSNLSEKENVMKPNNARASVYLIDDGDDRHLSFKGQSADGGRHSPNTVLAGTDSLFSQKDTWERMTVMMHGSHFIKDAFLLHVHCSETPKRTWIPRPPSSWSRFTFDGTIPASGEKPAV
ncbi:hypothetical protein EYF80_024205 [Liparis tanakae]|uniref:Uncharacterized protein n=1 Tax=Liparis tanakae TaxID=230148 RepID=A0A4Z2HI64_9TELE|nr:hypothetical protein EYF80_024205 [Liparis tanakae]